MYTSLFTIFVCPCIGLFCDDAPLWKCKTWSKLGSRSPSTHWSSFPLWACSIIRLMLPSPDQNVKIGSVGRFFFIFFLCTVPWESWVFQYFFILNGENSGGMQLKRIYKCFFKPLNTNFSKFFAQMWHFQKKNPPCFFAFYGRSGEGNITHIFFFWLTEDTLLWVYISEGQSACNLTKIPTVCISTENKPTFLPFVYMLDTQKADFNPLIRDQTENCPQK